MECYVLQANGNYEFGKWENVGIYSTHEKAEEAAKKLGGKYFTSIKRFIIDAPGEFPRWS